MGYIVKRTGKDGESRYHVVYNDRTGRRRWEAAGRFKKDAEKILSERESEAKVGVKPDKITFSEFAGRWLSDYAASHVKPRSLDDYRRLSLSISRPSSAITG